MERRKFLQYSLGLTGLFLLPESTFADQENKKKLAKYTFKFSSPYKTSEYKTTPHAHLEIKRLIEKHTNNNIYVDIRDAGQDGVGSSLSNSVAFGHTHCALISAANLAPKIPSLDILNIPFWSSTPEEYRRLFNSNVWQRHVLSALDKYQFKILLPYVVGARTATSTKEYGKTIVTPEDFVDLAFRVPGSKNLKLFYKMAKANPHTIAWKLTAKTARSNRFQALDPAITGLYSGPDNLRQEIGTISEIQSVHDGWLALANSEYIESLDSKTRTQFLFAWQEIQQAQLKQSKDAQNLCRSEFKKLGTRIYQPTKEEKQLLATTFGHEQAEWGPVKKRLLGEDGMLIFDGMYKAAKG